MSSPAGRGPAVALVLGSCVSLQVGAACAARLFPVAGSTGTTLLRLGLAALVLLVAIRPRAYRWDARQWLPVLAFGLTLAAMNGSFYAAIERIPLGTAVTVEFLGPLTLAAVLSRRLRELTWVLLAAEPVPSLRQYSPGLPKEVERLVNSALAKQPSRRLSSAVEFARSCKNSRSDSGSGLKRRWRWSPSVST